MRTLVLIASGFLGFGLLFYVFQLALRRVSGPRRTAALVVAGGLVTLAALTGGWYLTSVRTEPPPEQRGIGVTVSGVRATAAREWDVGLSVAQVVEVSDCDDVDVTLTVTPTAEFWIDNRAQLHRRARVWVAIPDAGISAVTVSTADRAAESDTPVVFPEVNADVVRDYPPTIKETVHDRRQDFTYLHVLVPRWGTTQRPLTVAFTAPWTQDRGFLGGCYVTVPAVTGLPTALSAAASRGKTVPLEEPLSGSPNFFTVSSTEAGEGGAHAYYRQEFEVTRGVTSLLTDEYTVDLNATLPVPDANFGGAPSWTCKAVPAGNAVGIASVKPGGPVDSDFLYPPFGKPAFSADRLEELLLERTCASYAALTPAGASSSRDLVLIGVGALFSLGIEIALSGFGSHGAPEPPPGAPRPRPRLRSTARRLSRGRGPGPSRPASRRRPSRPGPA